MAPTRADQTLFIENFAEGHLESLLGVPQVGFVAGLEILQLLIEGQNDC